MKTSFKLNNTSYSIFSFFVIALLLIIPDIIFSIFNNSFVVTKNPFALFFIFSISLLFIINKNKKLSSCLSIFLSIIQCAQFCHIKYFGVLISPAALYLMTKEVADVVEESSSIFLSYLYIFPLVLIPFFAIYKISHNRKLSKYKQNPLITIIVFFVSMSLPFFSSEQKGPNCANFSLENSVKAIIGYIEVIGQNHNFKNYKPYSVKKIKSVNESTTIVYILGESTNPNHMSLFGYSEDTTPKLRQLAQSPDFYYTNGISGGVTTISSCKFMCNAIREPDNVKETSLDTVNLFRLAKLNGFKTFYISSNTNKMLPSIGGMPYMDVLIYKEQYLTQFSKKRDTFLLELIAEQEFSEKNFIVIHQRCIHAPYKKTIPQSFMAPKKFTNNKNNTINEYDNAVLYNDSVISGLFNIFNKFKGKFYIIWTSDHNELMGENGLWGHSLLYPETAQVPVLIQSNDNDFLENIKEIFAITHYDICNSIANLLGFKIINPNEEKDIYYINGVDYIGRCGYIKFQKDYKNRRVKYFTN